MSEFPNAAPRRRNPLATAVLSLVLLVLGFGLGAWTQEEYGFPLGALRDGWFSGRVPMPQGAGPVVVPRYSNAQGAQDAPRSEVAEGRVRDREKCLETLRLRRVPLDEAQDTCRKILAGIGE